jgi:5-methyltetrahydrofolate--homocysteine methyltransferase
MRWLMGPKSTCFPPSLAESRREGKPGLLMNFTTEDWERHERNWRTWWAGELERPLVIIENPIRSRVAEELTREFLLEKPVGEVLDYYQFRLESIRYFGEAWPKWMPYFGAGIVAGFQGAQVHCAPEMETVWFEPAQPTSLAELQPTFDAENVWWQRVKELTQAAVNRWAGQVAIAHTDLGGNLDILASLRTTEKVLVDLYDAPDEVARLSVEITRLWLDYYDQLDDIIQQAGRGTSPWAPIWSPGRCYMLQSDFAYMISPDMFERYVLPDLAACCDRLDHAFYHLDGQGQIRHLDMLLSLDNLHGIQWIPGDGQPPPEAWLPLLRRIREGGKLCQLFVTPQGARTIVEALGGQGFAFYIMEPMSQGEATDFLRLLMYGTTEAKVLV